MASNPFDSDEGIDQRLRLMEILRPSTAEDIQDESHSSFKTVLLVNNLMRVLGELSENKAEALSKDVYALVRKYDAILDGEVPHAE